MTVESRAKRVQVEAILPKVSKPARYAGGEWNGVVKDWNRVQLRVALVYPDTYEIGTSHLGLQILYELINARSDALAERSFAPWVDFESHLRAAGLPLFALESRLPLASFDVLGFTLPYELTYSNVLNILDLSGLPVLAEERDDSQPLVVAGGSCAFNPEPLSDFIDLFVIGDGEEAAHDLLDALRDSGWRPSSGVGGTRRRREDFLRYAARISGVYVPSLYRLVGDQGVASVQTAVNGVPARIVKRLVAALPPAPIRPVVPYLEAVHDRAAVEIMRGCGRGCRFCQAGVIYRSVRERPLDEIVSMVDRLLSNTGYDELSLISLSSADHSQIGELVAEITRRHPLVNLSLPSLRVDSFSVELARAIRRRKTGFTFAPEAGSQRMRDIINKNVTEDDTLRAAEAAFGQGWSMIKLYFLIGLPGETMEDVAGIASLVKKMLAIGRRHHGHRAQINVSVNTLNPKPHSPFQWMGQDDEVSLREKQELLRRELRAVKLSWSDNRASLLETALARGDRRTGSVVHGAWQKGARFDAWGDRFSFERWKRAFDEAECNLDEYTVRSRSLDEPLPWDHIDSGVSKAYLRAEFERSVRGESTPDCHVEGRCTACGEFRLDPACLEAVRRAKMATDV